MMVVRIFNAPLGMTLSREEKKSPKSYFVSSGANIQMRSFLKAGPFFDFVQKHQKSVVCYNQTNSHILEVLFVIEKGYVCDETGDSVDVK